MKIAYIKSHWQQILLYCLAAIGVISIIALIIFGISVYVDGKVAIENVYLDRWDWLALIVAVISLLFGIVTYHSQWQTQKNTAKITPESQKQLLYEYARHFYANLIVISALRERMKGKYKTHYPSEEHFLKLKVDMSSLHPAIFIQNVDQYKVICKLQVLFRNFNEEVDVALTHFTNPNLIDEAKKRDLLTFDFKMEYFTGRVLDTLGKVFGENDTEYKDGMLKAIKAEVDERNIKQGEPDANLKEAQRYFAQGKSYYLTQFPEKMAILGLTDTHLKKFNEDIYVEMHCKNGSGSEKIYLIPFKEGTDDTQ